MLRTDSAGLARFKIPAKSYKFRVDYNSRQYWSDVVNLLPNEETAVSLQLDLLALDSTNDPTPVRVDGTPPKPEQTPWVPQKRVLLASLFEISGLLANAVVGQVPPEGGIYYFINDHLGTPQKVMDQSGAVVWSGDYRPFGSVNANVEDVGNNFRFQGQYYDSETGLHYNWHRYYDPKTGRYLTADPIGLAGGINLYAYVQDDPINYIDPYSFVSLSPIKEALKKVHKHVGGSLPKGKPGKFGSPQRGTPEKGYRLDPSHPDAPPGSPESHPHINWWDYTEGKKGKGGRYGVEPIIGGILGFIGNLLDPFSAISGELAGPEYDMIPLHKEDSECPRFFTHPNGD